MSEPLDAATLQAQLANLQLRLPDVAVDAPREGMAWLALCPAWPEQLAVEGLHIVAVVAPGKREHGAHAFIETDPPPSPTRSCV